MSGATADRIGLASLMNVLRAGDTVIIWPLDRLKAGRAGRDAVGQILSYMGDIAVEEDNGKVRGILVASTTSRP